jgi:type IV pilus assembly protein PilB
MNIQQHSKSSVEQSSGTVRSASSTQTTTHVTASVPAQIRQLKLFFRSGVVDLVPSQSWRTVTCLSCKQPTHFYVTTDRDVPVASCLSCCMRKPTTSGPKLLTGDILRKNGSINTEQIKLILQKQKSISGDPSQKRKRFAELAIEMGLCSPNQVARAVTELFQFEGMLDLQERQIPHEEISLIPREICERFKVICVGKRQQTFVIAMADPTSEEALIAVAQSLGRSILNLSPYLSTTEAIDEKLKSSYVEKGLELAKNKRDKGLDLHRIQGTSTNKAGAIVEADGNLIADDHITELRDAAEDFEALSEKLPEDLAMAEYEKIIVEGFKRGASDIHLEFLDSKKFVVRYRIDGILFPGRPMLAQYGLKIISIIKVKADIDTGDRPDKVYEGAYPVGFRKKKYRLRVELLPTFVGGKCMPKAVLRIFNPDSQSKTLLELGFDPHTLDLLQRSARQPNGAVLVAGSTGMGKSTTLAAIMREKVSEGDQMIYSLEDPIEYTLPGVNQIEVSTSPRFKHRSYHRILPAIQRADPNVVFIGEIRDRVTAGISFRAAIAGNLVFGTVHASDSPGVITRLRNFKIEQFILGDTTRLILSQRLVRKLCPFCKRRTVLSAELLRAAGFYFKGKREVELFEATPEGCGECTKGYKGRTVITEAMPISPRIRGLIIEGKDEHRIRMTAIRDGMITLRQSGLALILEGITSISEIQRVTGDFPDATIEAFEHASVQGENILENIGKGIGSVQ